MAEALAGVANENEDEERRLSWSCHHLLLLTATPHMGKDFPYYCLWKLLEPEVLTTIDAFNEAFNRHDVDAVMALMTEDCLFENTLPPPDGERHVGQKDVRKFWEKFFQESPRAKFETEEIVTSGDRAAVRWRFEWGDGYIRGIDLFRVRDGKVAEKLSYVKG